MDSLPDGHNEQGETEPEIAVDKLKTVFAYFFVLFLAEVVFLGRAGQSV